MKVKATQVYRRLQNSQTCITFLSNVYELNLTKVGGMVRTTLDIVVKVLIFS